MCPDQPRSIADPYADLLKRLPLKRRRVLISMLAQGYYDGWRPSRAEVADIVAVEMRDISVDEFITRQKRRRVGNKQG
jgi:hypothetical protein